ncbi:MAG: hypothetical protein IV100_08430, partial [Myxococcales bacterium]|nr:hypothetical protein [Myxococcales bacterium]
MNLSRLAALLAPFALALSCAPAPSETESKSSPVTDAPPALATASTSSALLYGPAERPFCGDTDDAGMSYELPPYGAPARPLWSSVDIPHPTDTLTRPTFDEEGVVNGSETIGLLNLPTYRNITHNLNLLQSLQFMISLVQNLANTLDDASEYVAEGQYVDDAIGWAGGQVIPQTVGHCVCVGSCAPSGCNPTAILDRVEDAIDTIVNDLNFEDVLTEFLTEQLEPVIAHLEDLEDYITNLFTDGNLLSSIVGTTVQNLLEDALADAIPLLPDPSVCDGVFDGTWTPDIDAALENALGLVQDAFDDDVAAIQNVIDTWNGAISPLLPEIKDTVVAIIDAFQGVDGITDLLNFDPQALITQIEGVVDQVNDAMPQIESAIESVTTLWDDLTGLEATLNALGDSVLDQVLSDLTGNPNTAACFQALIDSGAISQLGPGDFSFGGLADAFGDALQTQWDELLAQVQPIQDDLEAMINGLGQNATSYLTGLLEDAKDELVNAALAGCYARTMRSDCYDFCDPNGTIPPSTAPDSCFLWMPVDFLESPEGAVGAVASGALWVLKQVGFLDGLTQWLNDNVNDLLSGALGDVADALGTFGETLDRINAFMAKAFTYIDLFTEGYHLGAYTELRPDLHICIGYAGHGAYAQMGGLGGDNFSIGARYSSHNVSKENRVQFRSGGFACSAFGHEISILPGIELNAQIQGFKLWDIREPFGIPINLPISADVLARLDAFATATDDGVGAPFDLPVDGSGSIPFGAFIVRDLHPVPNSEAIQTPGNDHIWPRREVFDVFTPEMTPAAPDWEDSSIAVVSAGVNLPLVLDPPRKELPAITIVPGILSAIPWFDISAGVEWKHETDMMRGKIQEAVNGNLPESLQLDEDDFERNMHAMAPDDLTADNGTYVFVEPGLGLDVFLGFNIWKIRIGAYASLGLYVNIKPGGTGGILDLNSALSDTLLHSNPPPEAPCEPVIEPIVTETCNSPLLGGAPEPGYSCRSGDSSCCIKATFDPPAGEHQEYSACVDDWTGLDKKACEEFNATAGDVTETFVQILAQAPGYSDKLDGLLAKLATLGVGEKSIIATWNEGVRCEDSDCGKNDTLDGGGPVVTTAILDLQSLSECETHGYCILDDETVHHDVTEPECSDLLNGDEDGDGGTDDAQCATVRFTQVDLGDMVCALADDDVAGTTGEVRCWTPGSGWTTALSGESPAPYDHRVAIECDSARCSWLEDTGVSGAVNYAHGPNVFGSPDPSSCADPAVDCDFPSAPMFDSTIGHEGTVGLDPFTLRLQWEDEFCQTNAGNPVPSNPQRCTSSYLAITLGCGSASMTCDPSTTTSASTFQQVEGDADSLCGLSAKGFSSTGTLPAWNATGEARPGSEGLCAWPRLTPQVPVLNPGPVTCAGAVCPPGYTCSEDAELPPTCVLPFNSENYRRTIVNFGDSANADFVDIASAGNHVACAIHAATNATEPLSIACKAFNASWNTCGQAILLPPQGQWIDLEPAGVCTMCALSADRQTIACWGDEVLSATGSASVTSLVAAPGVPFVDLGGMSAKSDWSLPAASRPYVVCGVTEGGQIVCNDPAFQPPPVPTTSCDGEPAGASGSNLTGPPGFYPYQCYQATTYEITDWTGDGCHPLQHGFPTACGCADDGDCSSDAGETCNTDSGKCQSGGVEVECACDATDDCPAGRICSSGSCARACAANTDCATSAECVSGVCQPKNGIPWAETITWGMQNVEAPMHTISSYAFSEIYATLIFTLGVGVEASFKLFGKVRKWTLFEFHDAWDIGSTWKGWYQP